MDKQAFDTLVSRVATRWLVEQRLNHAAAVQVNAAKRVAANHARATKSGA